MAPKLYTLECSPPVRSVLITAAGIGLDLEKEYLDLFIGNHLKPEFVELNPQHTVPTLVDGDYVLWDSHSIVTYLVSKYAKDDSFYPKDLQKRGTVDNRLHLDNTVLIAIIKQIGRALFFERKNSYPENVLKDTEDAYTLLDTLLKKTTYAAGDEVTVADFCWITSVTTLKFYLPVDERKWPHLAAWVERIKKLPCYTVNESGLKQYKQYASEQLNQ